MKTPFVAPYPTARFRRAKQSPEIRGLVRENTLTTDDLIWPVFICDGEKVSQPVPSMPGVLRRSVDLIVDAAKEAADADGTPHLSQDAWIPNFNHVNVSPTVVQPLSFASAIAKHTSEYVAIQPPC